LTKIGSLVKLWEKGHAPSPDDWRIESALEVMSMSDYTSIPVNELSTIEAKLIMAIESKMNEQKRKKFAEQMVGA
jgi:hypothetical protein